MLSEQGRDPAQFPAYVEQLKAQARAQGISEATLAVAFANIHFVDRVIQSDRNQLEKKVTLDDYLAKVLTPSKIAQGKEIYQHYQPQLSQVTARYGYLNAILWRCGEWKVVLVRFKVKKM